MKKALIKGVFAGLASFLGMIILLPILTGMPGVIDIVVYLVFATGFGGYEFLKEAGKEEV